MTINSMQFQSLMKIIVDFLRKLREDTAQLWEIADKIIIFKIWIYKAISTIDF